MKRTLKSILLGFAFTTIFWILSLYFIVLFELKLPVLLWDLTWLFWPIFSVLVYKKLKRREETLESPRSTKPDPYEKGENLEPQVKRPGWSIFIKTRSIYLVIAALLLFIFYWFQLRPSQIRSACDQIEWDSAEGYYEDYDWKFTQCLHSKGLK